MDKKTTVTIDQKHTQILSKLCARNRTNKKEFLCSAIVYLEKYGINPLEHDSPAMEMNKLIKRVDQVIRFIKVQEKEMLRPALEAICSSEERIKVYLNSIATKEDVSERLRLVLSAIHENQVIVKQSKMTLEQSFKILARLIDPKEKSSVFTELSKIYQQQ